MCPANVCSQAGNVLTNPGNTIADETEGLNHVLCSSSSFLASSHPSKDVMCDVVRFVGSSVTLVTYIMLLACEFPQTNCALVTKDTLVYLDMTSITGPIAKHLETVRAPRCLLRTCP